MSQREGSVLTRALRRKGVSPVVEKGSADLIIGFGNWKCCAT